METSSAAGHILRDLLIFIVARLIVLGALLVIISGAPGKWRLVAFSRQGRASRGARAARLIWYWWTFFRNARRGPPGKSPP